MKEAIRHSPVYPPWFIDTLAAAYREMGDVGRSIAAARDALRLNPENLAAYMNLCSGSIVANEHDQAGQAARDALTIDPAFSLSKYAKTQLYQDAATLVRLIDGLRKAGLPE